MVSFENPDTGKKLSIELEVEITLIYGGNGTGKTTLSRAFGSDYAVFNSDFVNKNVYIVNSDGATTNSDNKENFSQLFLGTDAVELAKKVESMIVLKKITKKRLMKNLTMLIKN